MTIVNWLSPLAANELPGKRLGDISGVEGNETVVWLMQTDSAYETLATLIAYGVLPTYLSPHPQAPYATLRKLTYKPVAPTAASVGAYEVTGHYSSAPLSQEDRDKSILDPTQRPAKITLKSKVVFEASDRDRNGKAKLNSTGDAFDPPPEKASVRWVFTVTKNLASVPAWFLGYEETVNNSDFDIKGVTVLKGCGKLSGIAVSEDMVENGIPYLQLSFEIECKPVPDAHNAFDGNSPEDSYEPTGWTTIYLDQGFRWRRVDMTTGETAIVKIEDDDGNDLQSPWPLNGHGQPLSDPKADTAVWLCWEDFPEKDFSVIPVT